MNKKFMCYFIYNITNDINYIPSIFLTQEICEKHFQKTKNINLIPHKFRTQKMIDEYSERMKDIEEIFSDITKNFKKESNDNFKNKNLKVQLAEEQ